MHSIEVKELNKRFWIPENLAECKRKQYLDMSKLVLMYQMAEISKEQFRVLALYNLMNMVYSESELPNVQEEKWQNIYICSELIDSFFHVDDAGVMHLVQDYIHNPVKVVSYKAMTFKGPKDGFQDITWKQLVDGFGEVDAFLQDGKVERLVRLFAMFYLSPRSQYGKFDMDRRLKFFDQLDIRYVYSFYLLFLSFRKFLREQSVIKIDGREIDFTILFDGSANTGEEVSIDLPELGFRSTSFQLAESGVFGPKEMLDQTNAWDVLTNIYDMVVRNKKKEAEMEAQKNKK
ncbi:hypothetical protein [Chryseobacterium sp. FH1]|uniref:hypothetical protein n=1 Tax=Chryseobacterium sp. FH1 TaxID=1233951 RepID=UPI0004E43B0C|nr:hypothetical protein [Chryseobacterium sp. FH1]KFC19372.1 hypothetical protein IO90_08700 [Chryseobacterium sp. FH1]